MSLALLLLAACVGGGGDSAGTAPCPALDCRDALTLRLVDETGAPVTAFVATWDDGAGFAGELDCASGTGGSGSAYCVDGTLTLFFYGPTVQVEVVDAACTHAVSTTVEAAWEAPYDSEDCGHYCWIGDETLTLEPVDLECEGG